MRNLGTQQPFVIIHTSTTSLSKTLKKWKERHIQTIISVPTSWIFCSELLRVEQKYIAPIIEKEGFEKCLHAEVAHTPLLDNYFVETLRHVLVGTTT